MIEWSDKMSVYHGSFCIVPNADLTLGSPLKDFGRGFYVTTSFQQAKSFVATAIRKACHTGRCPADSHTGYVTAYTFADYAALSLHEFPTADADWLHCIAAHRKPSLFSDVRRALENLDVLAGKIANDQTNATLTAYLSGLYGPIGSPEADRFCIGRLLPERLENQICLKTARALSHLSYEGATPVCLTEL